VIVLAFLHHERSDRDLAHNAVRMVSRRRAVKEEASPPVNYAVRHGPDDRVIIVFNKAFCAPLAPERDSSSGGTP
jgi:hypothetical protein